MKSLLREKGASVATIAPGATVAEVLNGLAHHGVGALVVSFDGRRIDGIVSERDVVRALQRHGPEALDGTVASIMTMDVRTCAPDDEAESLMAVMTEHRIRHLPVVDGGGLAGIVSIGDVVKARLGELERENHALHDYIHTGR